MAAADGEAGDVEVDVEAVELELLLEGLHRVHGLDLRNYARTSLRRRLVALAEAERVASLSALQERVLRDRASASRLIEAISVQTTAMFRDPPFYRALRERVVPILRTYPFARIWHAGCATGEEVWSMAIVLEEEGVRERCRIYATDLSEAALSRARRGAFPLEAMKDHTTSYLAAGGARSLSDYYTADHEVATFRPSLAQGIVFARHDLARDRVFNEFQLVLCRNVLFYFDATLQERAFGVLDASLARLGLLALGANQSLPRAPARASYDRWDERGPIFKKAR